MHEIPLKTWFNERRHIEVIKGDKEVFPDDSEEWRKTKGRMKTVSVALALCLNIGVDPPDLIKPPLCAKREAGVDPSLMNPTKVPEKVAQMLQKNYERLQPRARYKAAIDPTVDYLRKLCMGLRRSAKDERVLFHYNGHGVPRPTDKGEIWVFNKTITQYIPLSLFDLQTYMQTPSVYVWDTHDAGLIIEKFLQFAKDQKTAWSGPQPSVSTSQFEEDENEKPPDFTECIHLGACSANELLPTDPNLPADLFTCCLTTPIQASLLWYVLKTKTKDRYPLQLIENLPGNVSDRKSIFGELNWIFTAITDTIAWNRLPKDLFQKLFRQDLLVASLFRSFLLAEKIMKDYGCRVVSHPKLDSVADHPLWDSWEYTIELCLINLYNRANKPPEALYFSQNDCYVNTTAVVHSLLVEFNNYPDDGTYNWFFVDQLKAFDIWLRFDIAKESPPDQLPVVLQVLLSQVHRVQALELLARFLDIGPWSVLESLFVGVFPYVLKLLQSATKELKNSLTFIWARILIVDPKCSEDLLCEENFEYFIKIIKDKDIQPRYKIIPVFVLCTLMKHHPRDAQRKFFQADYLNIVNDLIIQADVMACKMLCVWLLISLGKLWNNYDEARWHAIRVIANYNVALYLTDDVPEVRAAAVYALGQLMSNRSSHNDHAMMINYDIIDKIVESCAWDGSVLVRLELAVAIQWYIIDHESKFAELCLELDRRLFDESQKTTNTNSLNGSINSNSGNQGRRTISAGSNSSQSDYYGGPHMIPRTEEQIEKEMRDNMYRQWKILEAKPFKGPYERVLIVLLRLYFDPMKQVRDLAEKLVNHIVIKANTIKKNLIPESARPRFTVGSPISTAEFMESQRRSSNTFNRPRIPQMRPSSSSSELERVQTSSTTLTPKRPMYGSRYSDSSRTGNSISEELEFLNPIVKTEFVEWSGKIFSNRIYRTLYEEGEIDAREWMVDGETCCTRLIPSDWALHTAEGLEQYAEQEMKSLREKKATFQPTPMVFPFEEQYDAFNRDKRDNGLKFNKIYCMEWSYLRPYVYLCDGRIVYAYNTQHRSKPFQPSFAITVNDDKLFDDPVTDVLSVNEKSHELMIMGTRDGLISVWDPKFNVHSHEVEGRPKMLTSNFIFNDQTRVFMQMTTNGKTIKGNEARFNHSLYQWDQNSGRLLCGGNVRVARIWDAWAEKKKVDFDLPKNAITTALCADFNQQWIAVGFDTGNVNIFDIRIGQQLMTMPANNRSKVVGASFLEKSSNVVAGYQDGSVKVFDPRQYQDPIQDFNVAEKHIEFPKPHHTTTALTLFGGGHPKIEQKKLEFKLTMHKMVTQQSNNIIGCALNDGSVRLFDIQSHSISLEHVLYPNSTVPTYQSGINAFKFHSRRAQFGLVNEKNVFGLYSINGT